MKVFKVIVLLLVLLSALTSVPPPARAYRDLTAQSISRIVNAHHEIDKGVDNEPDTGKTARRRGLLAPRLIKDIYPGDESSDSEMFVRFNGAVYFRANDGSHGIELWKTDGTPDGTNLVIDLRSGIDHALPGGLAVAGGRLYFHAFTEPTGSKVFTSDGTAEGTAVLIDTYPGAPSGPGGSPLPSNFISYNDHVLFTATDPKAGYELWTTDGTTASTKLVTDIHPGQQWSVPVGLTPFAGRVFFAADDKFTNDPPGSPFGYFDRELFVTDGTHVGTFRVKDINPGPRPSIPFNFTVFGEQMLFTANDGTNGTELWTTDGTESGTRILKDINPNGPSFPMDLKVVGKRVLFTANDGVTGSELWASDGTEEGTHLVKDINPDTNLQSYALTGVGERVFFMADDGKHGRELWVSDGTEEGTYMVKDIHPGAASSSPFEMIAVGDRLFFTAICSDNGSGTVTTGLWMSDGTEAGTKLVWQAPGRAFGYAIMNLTLLGNKLLFTAPTSVDSSGLSTNTELYGMKLPCKVKDGGDVIKCRWRKF